MGLREHLAYPCLVTLSKVERGLDVVLPQIRGCVGANAPNLSGRKLAQESCTIEKWNDREPCRLFPFRSDFCQCLGGREADAKCHPELTVEIFLDSLRYLRVAHVEHAAQPSQVSKTLINGIFLHIGAVATHNAVHALRKERVGLVIRWQDDRVGAYFLRFKKTHSALHAERLGFIGA